MTSRSAKTNDKGGLRTVARITLGAWLIYLSVLAPSLATWDGGGMLRVAVSVVEKHSITVPAPFGVPGRGGQTYAIWYPLLSVVAIPFAAAGLLAARYAHLPSIYVVSVFAILLSTIIAALNVGATYYLARSRLGASHRRALAAALAFGFGTLALWYSRTFYADPLLALLVTLAMIVLFADEPSGALLALLCGLAILAKPVGVLLAPAAFLYLVVRRKYRTAFVSAAGAALGAGLYAAYDWARFGNVFASGQPNLWSLRELPRGLAGLLVSPGVGLLICCPVVILAIRRRLSREAWFIWGLTGGFLLLYSCWLRWYASDWGPRFLLPVVPALVALSVLTRHKRAWLALAMLGLVMQVPTLFGAPERYEAVLRQRDIPRRSATWNLKLAPTSGMWGSAIAQLRAAEHTNLREFATYRPHAARLAQARDFRIVPLWWWMLPLVHLPRALGIVVAAFEMIVGLWMIFWWGSANSYFRILRGTVLKKAV